MKILVYANCQVHQIVMALSFMMMGRAQILSVDINHPNAADQLRQLASSAGAVDFVVTNHVVDDLRPYFDATRIVSIPSIVFGGFHPDVIYFSKRESPSKPLFFKNNPTISAVGLWGFLRGCSVELTEKLFRDDVFESLRYGDYFDVCSEAIRKNYADHGFSTDLIERFLSGREVFVHGPMHPKLPVTLVLCEALCRRLEVKPSFAADELAPILPDPLQNEYAWGCYPPLAALLGIKGSWMVRHYQEVFPTTRHYLGAVFQFLQTFPSGSIQFFEKDAIRFAEFHMIDKVLGGAL